MTITTTPIDELEDLFTDSGDDDIQHFFRVTADGQVSPVSRCGIPSVEVANFHCFSAVSRRIWTMWDRCPGCGRRVCPACRKAALEAS